MERIDDSVMRRALFRYYNRTVPQVTMNAQEVDPSLGTTPLVLHADTYNYVLLDGRRITPTSRSTRNTVGSSIIQGRFGNETSAGEVRAVLVHRQPGVPNSEHTALIMVAWMKESDFSPLNEDDGGFIWNKFPELDINTWQYQEYENPMDEASRPLIIPLDEIQCQVSRGTIEHTEPKLWITTTLDRVSRVIKGFPNSSQVIVLHL
ncbi:hypothetical protein C8F04DRAFT_626281, partial [Mycena alexandri]